MIEFSRQKRIIREILKITVSCQSLHTDGVKLVLIKLNSAQKVKRGIKFQIIFLALVWMPVLILIWYFDICYCFWVLEPGRCFGVAWNYEIIEFVFSRRLCNLMKNLIFVVLAFNTAFFFQLLSCYMYVRNWVVSLHVEGSECCSFRKLIIKLIGCTSDSGVRFWMSYAYFFFQNEGLFST